MLMSEREYKNDNKNELPAPVLIVRILHINMYQRRQGGVQQVQKPPAEDNCVRSVPNARTQADLLTTKGEVYSEEGDRYILCDSTTM
jgi:hypothetical protein